MADSEKKLVEALVTANRILANEGIIDVFGHVSVRSERNPKEFLLSCSRAPNSVKAPDIMRYRLDSSQVTPTKEKPYVERVIHGGIYQARPDVHAVCHTHSDSVLPFAVTGETIRPVIHVGTLFWEGVGWLEHYDRGGNLLVASAAEGKALAEALGSRRAVVLRNHGCAVAGENLIGAVMSAIYLEKNARAQLEACRLGKTLFIDPEEGRRGAQVFLSTAMQERAWNYWVDRLPQGWRQQAGLRTNKTGAAKKRNSSRRLL